MNTGEAEIRNDTPAASLALEKGLRVLSCFDVQRPQWSFTEICVETGLAKATAFRVLKTLQSAGYLDFDQTSAKYHLGPSMLRSAHLALSHTELVWAAHPFVVRLAEETTETVNLSVWTSRAALIVDAVLTSRPFKPYNPVGLLISSIASVHVKLFRAYGRHEERELVSDGDLERSREQIIVLEEARAREIEQVKSEGLAFDIDDWIAGVSAVGAPVFDASGEIRAAIAVIVPSERFGPGEREAHAKAALRTAQGLSQKLGFKA